MYDMAVVSRSFHSNALRRKCQIIVIPSILSWILVSSNICAYVIVSQCSISCLLNDRVNAMLTKIDIF